MSLFYAIILGLIQGLTEFLPVSSSGHLVIAQSFLGFSEPPILFDVMLHGGTLLAIFVFFRKDIWMIISGIFAGSNRAHAEQSEAVDRDHPRRNEGRWFAFLVIIGTVPAVIVGFALKDFFESLFSSPATVGFMLCVTAAILYFADRQIRREKTIKKMSLWDALLIGIFQAAAIIPGISRSGSTISMGIFRRLTSETAARFSFVLSIPAIIGAIALEALDINELSVHDLGIYLVGTAVAAVTGYLSISLLIRTIRAFKLKAFSIYLWIVGFAVIWINILFKPAA